MKKLFLLTLLLVTNCYPVLASETAQVTAPEPELVFGQQLYVVAVHVAATTPEGKVSELCQRLKADPQVQDIFSHAHDQGIQQYQVICKAHTLAQQAEGDESICTKTLISARNQEWRYWFDTYKPYIITVGTGLFSLTAIATILYVKTRFAGSGKLDGGNVPLNRKKKIKTPRLPKDLAQKLANTRVDQELDNLHKKYVTKPQPTNMNGIRTIGQIVDAPSTKETPETPAQPVEKGQGTQLDQDELNNDIQETNNNLQLLQNNVGDLKTRLDDYENKHPQTIKNSNVQR